MKSIQINENYFITYKVRFGKKRQIFLNFLAPINQVKPELLRKKCFWTLIDDSRYGKREPHFLIHELIWLLTNCLSNQENFKDELGEDNIRRKKCQILWIFTHICGKPLSQNLVDKFQEISGINMLEEKNKYVWDDNFYNEIWVKELSEKQASFKDPIPIQIEDEITYEGIPYVELDAPIGYLNEIQWISYESDYEISCIENQLDEIEEEEANQTQKLYTPHRDMLIITTLESSSKIEIMYYQEKGNENAPIPKLDLGWIDKNVEIVFKPQDYEEMEEPLTKLQESIAVEIYPGYKFKSKDNLYLVDDVLWQKNPYRGWICVDERLVHNSMISIRDFRNITQPNYHLITYLTKLMNNQY